jgi:ActR/RegA family two-component response regulator
LTTLRSAFLVDTNTNWLETSRRAIGDSVDLKIFSDFRSAREQLLKTPPQFLATNLRLGAYNGLHLVYLAAAECPDTRCVVYSDRADLTLVREAQLVGAFYEDASRIGHALHSYMTAALPERDRRNPERVDRRQLRRGGRRSADIMTVTQAGGDKHLSLH